MKIDVERLLRRVVADVFDETVQADYSVDPRSRYYHRVRLSTEHGGQRRNARLVASYWVFEAAILDLGVGAVVVDEDYDEDEKETALREMALLVRAYLDGEGRVEQRRRLLRTYPVLRITVDDREWELARRWSKGSHL